MAAALGTRQLRTATMQWGGGGGGCCAAVAHAAASIVVGLADCVVVFRSLAQGQYGRFGQAAGIHTVSGERSYLMPYGVLAPPQRFAMRVQRYMHEHGVRQEALRAIALASYHHEVGQFRNGLRQVVVSTPDCASGALRFPYVDAPAVGEDCIRPRDSPKEVTIDR
ncbi:MULTISPECIES: NADPH2:quinone reductase [Bradyrhizobium]|uniref:NADPH2:quinone reductase n=2 Tax=Pseudomonadota TaxID=1224 RepID=UPI0003969904|nr:MULTISPECIES: NADPH2:quinone reductase [Bradyrhizobium]ERF81017.1 MAG: NADPH2:quinone reductase [Bradyrhizobium sp. DFCI-1]